MMSFEEKMKKELKKNLEIPDVVEQKKNWSLNWKCSITNPLPQR